MVPKYNGKGIKGGKVLEPKVGIYENVMTLDFANGQEDEDEDEVLVVDSMCTDPDFDFDVQSSKLRVKYFDYDSEADMVVGYLNSLNQCETRVRLGYNSQNFDWVWMSRALNDKEDLLKKYYSRNWYYDNEFGEIRLRSVGHFDVYKLDTERLTNLPDDKLNTAKHLNLGGKFDMTYSETYRANFLKATDPDLYWKTTEYCMQDASWWSELLQTSIT
ncbi:hypothetical protein SARC_06925 [Sphaeroforma arctica JP610]|uniref:DNA-directed DNA polymerase family B exonuclease domain-containing protein n=1 Tax=Sphaeroforma arctica JP610 TaxID=667725 RepID=A0A0L0FXN3_9EUKA|nr:hypothetical protein SARC_06925 [Sphaeroforma arctica JP610]KNC80723.1 hypothetical protein SARC_06925 [Sphaeroforma arctica JP610]|eukprot:XP_014154625.1 hypothetical protein SARC_06925 [Sphaeroforma arctica JP610]